MSKETCMYITDNLNLNTIKLWLLPHISAKAMKFRLKFINPRPRKKSATSGSSNSKRHNQNIQTVQSWNELRKIGSEAYKPHAAENVLKEQRERDDGLQLQEAQDWDAYIAEFNAQYREQLHTARNERDEVEERSVSTVAETKSELMRGRYRRMLVYRKCFIMSCLLLWAINFFGCHEWYLTYLIYPTGFLHGLDNSLASKFFTPPLKWFAFLANAHTWMVGCFGFLCIFCFREDPRWLKQFILRVPLVCILPFVLIMVAVRFVGTFSSQKLEKQMDKSIPLYHLNTTELSKEADADLSSKRIWDQLQKIVYCAYDINILRHKK